MSSLQIALAAWAACAIVSLGGYLFLVMYEHFQRVKEWRALPAVDNSAEGEAP